MGVHDHTVDLPTEGEPVEGTLYRQVGVEADLRHDPGYAREVCTQPAQPALLERPEQKAVRPVATQLRGKASGMVQ